MNTCCLQQMLRKLAMCLCHAQSSSNECKMFKLAILAVEDFGAENCAVDQWMAICTILLIHFSFIKKAPPLINLSHVIEHAAVHGRLSRRSICILSNISCISTHPNYLSLLFLYVRRKPWYQNYQAHLNYKHYSY